MGYGCYSYEAHQDLVQSRASQSRKEIFRQDATHPLMNPRGVGMRESRDSLDHPLSLPVIFALDVTGSMGAIPERLARQELPSFMKALLDIGVTDPQVLFMAFGDVAHDLGALQVGQFESSAETMDQWLTWTWLEGGGGGNQCESYDLAMYFAARHTLCDALLKRGKRGYFFMTGDENPYPQTAGKVVRDWIGDDLTQDLSLEQVSQELANSYHAFFLIPDPGRAGRCEAAWRKVMGDHVVILRSPDDTCLAAASLVALCEGAVRDLDQLAQRLKSEGHSRTRIGRLLEALAPFAATLGPQGLPPLEMVGL